MAMDNLHPTGERKQEVVASGFFCIFTFATGMFVDSPRVKVVAIVTAFRVYSHPYALSSTVFYYTKQARPRNGISLLVMRPTTFWYPRNLIMTYLVL